MPDKSTLFFTALDIATGTIFFFTPLPLLGNLLAYVFFVRSIWNIVEDVLYSEK
ncbi:MAG: hypothetical protein HY512_04170 [Candidatus Aenigmarchaeota archaeon]|nr:hypothetical protein [Candidatus Aenigmarchaeota archaeon]